MMAPYFLVNLWVMFNFDAAAFVKATEILHVLIGRTQAWTHDEQLVKMTQESVDQTSELIERLDDALGALDVPITKMTTKETLELLSSAVTDGTTYFDAGQLLVAISNTLRREVTASSVFVLDKRRADFYRPAEPLFGAQVASQFSSICDEISSAGKCYACDLPTAFAFHTLRSMEAGLRAIYRCLGIPDPTTGAGRNWSNMVRAIKSAMDAKWNTATLRMSSDAKDLEAIYGALVGMMNPYRNETMHLNGIYSATEAMHIFELVKGLMQKVASRMDENGLPLA